MDIHTEIFTAIQALDQSGMKYFILGIVITIGATAILAYIFHRLGKDNQKYSNDIQKKETKVRRKKVHDFVVNRVDRIQNALDLQQQNLDAIDAGKASGITKEGLNVGIWKVIQGNYIDIKFTFLSNLVDMPKDADIDELDSLLFTDPIIERIVAGNEIQDIDKIIHAAKEFIKKLE